MNWMDLDRRRINNRRNVDYYQPGSGSGSGLLGGLLISLALVCLYCTAEMEGWMDGSKDGEIIRVEEWTASCFPRVLD